MSGAFSLSNENSGARVRARGHMLARSTAPRSPQWA
jgi:hypothetical protein